MNITAMKLETIYGEPLVLEGAEINGVIHDLLSEVTVRQTYSNHEDKPIEAVYTFPMPIDAVLLNMTVQIGERTLSGRILPKKEAEERYEEAITDGNSAMMLQKVESGMYTANVGNIAPGERVSLVMTYTTRHELRDGSVRFRLPTVIAPRYGNALQAGFEEHQVPETRLAAENRFSFILTAQGKLAGGDITSPSHKLVMNKTAHGIDISLADGRATMDRDIIVVFKPELPPLSCAWQGHDLNEQTAVMAWFTPLFNPKQATARHIKLVLDCSGSMGGEK
ncbi:MAG: VIT domain-containing protein, partial [Gammaproteobacteria bacterium]|nr:VIT domain-containing protein [Gammaproteobacteria bacterium]